MNFSFTFSWARVAIALVCVVVLHVAVVADLRVLGVAGELPLGLAIAAGLVGGAERGAAHGAVLGFVIDVFAFTPLGLGVLVLGVVGWAAGHLYLNRLEESHLVSAVAIGLGSAVALVIWLGSAVALGESTLLRAPLLRIVTIAGLINAALAVPLMATARWMWASDPLSQRGDRVLA